jgi:biopolymer transport protein ExbD
MKLATIGVVIAGLGGCIVSPVMHFGAGKSPQQAQHEEYTRVTPASFAEHHEWTGEITTAKIRVWADDAYRAQNIHWEQTFQAQLDATNDVLAAMFGVRLVADFHAWSRHAPDATLDDSLAALATADPGDNVLSVVGLTSSIALVSATFEQLGVAHLGGNHLVVRGYADLEERKIFEANFTELRAEERDVLYQARRRHKTTAIFLHELAHNLGADHVPDEDTLMHATYTERASSFDPHSRELILAALDARVRPDHAAPRLATERPAATVVAAPAAPGAHHGHAKLFVRIDDQGQRSIAGQLIDTETLDDLLRMSHRDDPETEIVIKATVHAPRPALVELLDRAKTAGLEHYSFASP